jgi:amino acid transporter
MAILSDKGKETGGSVLETLGLKNESSARDVQEGVMAENADNLQRHLGNRQIQLIAIGGSIGTALFVSIGSGLYHGGPGSLLIAFTVQCIFLAMVNNCLAEMTTAFPVSGGFIRLAGKWVDDALGFMVGWNFLSVLFSASPKPCLLSLLTLYLASMRPS